MIAVHKGPRPAAVRTLPTEPRTELIREAAADIAPLIALEMPERKPLKEALKPLKMAPPRLPPLELPPTGLAYDCPIETKRTTAIKAKSWKITYEENLGFLLVIYTPWSA
jgi:hypothetical protein